MNEIYEISQNTHPLNFCPVIVFKGTDEVDTEDEADYEACGTVLQVMMTRTIVGDDYGEWPQIGVYFDCGHTLAQMEQSLKYGDTI